MKVSIGPPAHYERFPPPLSGGGNRGCASNQASGTSLTLRPGLCVEARALARRVVHEATDVGLVDQVRGPLEQRDHWHLGAEGLADTLDQGKTLVVVQLVRRPLQLLRDRPVAVLRVVARAAAAED